MNVSDFLFSSVCGTHPNIFLNCPFIPIFLCLFQMVFGNCGVLCEIGPSKGYVEMTNIDAETSNDISDVSYFTRDFVAPVLNSIMGQCISIFINIFLLYLSLQAIITKGGRYLEAQVQGSKLQAEDGTLVVLAAGDRTLFDECQSCFEAMGKNSFFLGM